ISTATSADWPRPPRAGGCRTTPSPGAEPSAANAPCRDPAAVPICPSPHSPRRVTLEGRRTQRKGIAMSNPTTANIWPTFRYRDASAAIAFLGAAFGFEVAAKYENSDDPQRIDHAELRWPGGGGIMLGSARDEGVMTKTSVASGSVYIAADDVEELYHRAIAAGAVAVMGLTEQDHGSPACGDPDPDGAA